MVREARKKSSTGIYHVMLRGLDKRYIFLEDSDKEKFLDTLHKCSLKGLFEILGYCLMDNHVHLLIKESESLGTSIKRITVSYVQWHNIKYARTGHLFQNRYKSEPIESEKQLLAVLRYIHQNPLKAKMVKSADEYPWSSYNYYIKSYQGENVPIYTQLYKNYFITLKSFKDFMNQNANDKFLDYKEVIKYTDTQLIKKIQSTYQLENFQSLSKKEYEHIVVEIYNDLGISIRQLSRALGIGKGVIERILEDSKRKRM